MGDNDIIKAGSLQVGHIGNQFAITKKLVQSSRAQAAKDQYFLGLKCYNSGDYSSS